MKPFYQSNIQHTQYAVNNPFVVQICQSLLLPGSSRKTYSVGEIINFMSVDAQRIADSTTFLHNLWAAPVNIIGEKQKLYHTVACTTFISN